MDKTGGESWGEPNRRNGIEETIGAREKNEREAVIKAAVQGVGDTINIAKGSLFMVT